MSSKWGTRTGLYKAAFGFTIFVFLVYGLAFGLPSWIGFEYDATNLDASGANVGDHNFQGLWLRCLGDDEFDFDDCDEHSFGDDWDWMDGVRGCWTGGMFLFLVGVVYGLMENCCGREDSKDYGITGALVLFAGLAGAAGVILIAVKVEDDSDNGLDNYYWGYMIACIASGLAILLSLVLLIGRKTAIDDDASYEDDKQRHGSARAFDYINNYGKPSPSNGYGYPYEYHNAGYRADAYPPHHPPMTHGDYPPVTNGVSYNHQPAGHPAGHPYTMYHGNSSSLPRQVGGGGPNWRHSVAESADLSNGFTPTILQAEQQQYGRPVNRGDYYMNGGGSRPY